MKHITLGIILLLVAACGSPSTSAIKKTAGIGDEGKICTQIAATSLLISVQVPSGWDAEQLHRELTVTATLDKQPVSFPAPEVTPGEINYTLYEQTGTFDITAKLRSTSESLNNFVVKKDASGCHAEGRAIDMQLLPPNRIVLTPAN